jgi:hypothetical protein
VVRVALAADHGVIGYRRGWAGVLDGDHVSLGRRDIAGVLPRGGTMLLSSRTNPFADGADGPALCRTSAAAHSRPRVLCRRRSLLRLRVPKAPYAKKGPRLGEAPFTTKPSVDQQALL